MASPTWYKRSKMRFRSSTGTPGPRSVTDTMTVPFSPRASDGYVASRRRILDGVLQDV